MPQNNNYKQDFLAIKYDYDTQCSMSEDVLSNYIRVLDSKINPQAQGLGTISGTYIGRNIPAMLLRKEFGIGEIYYVQDGEYTKMVRTDGIARFYVGDANERGVYMNWSNVSNVPPGAYVYNPPTAPSVSSADISGAFQPIGQYYSNLLDIKKRLNKFLETASEDIGESQSYLANEERYDNRGHPEKSVTSKEIAYGLFSEVRPSTIPILMALGTFMASVSILMIFQMFGFTSQINVPPAVIAFQTWLATPGQLPAYQNPMILGGVITVLSVAVVLLGVMYLRSKQ
jgi:hypothetical protein